MNTTNAEWMFNLSDKISNTRINHIILPGSHNSGAYSIDWSVDPNLGNSNFGKIYKWSNILPCVKDITTDWTQTQQYTIYEQLLLGIRYLDLRLVYINDTFYLAHTFICQPLSVALADIQKFLIEYPDEVLIIEFSREWENRATMTKDRSNAALDIVYKELGSYLVPKTKNNEFPTFGELFASRWRIILYFRPSHTRRDYVWDHSYIHSNWTTTIDINKKLLFLNAELSKMQYNNCNLNSISFTCTPGASDIVNDTLKRIFLPCVKHKNLQGLATSMQQQLPAYATMHKDQIRRVSIISTDFPTVEFITEIINLNTVL